MFQHFRVVAVAAAGLAAAACGGDGGVLLGTLERDRIELIAEAREPIVEVAVREGDAVAEGQLLLRLDTTAVDAHRRRVAGGNARAL